MRLFLDRFYQVLSRPLAPGARPLLALIVIPLGLAFTAPLWNIRMTAPQYPQGLELDIYAHTIDAGNQGRDLQEINTLNHYIGMRRIDRVELSDLDWIPFAIGALGLLTLRVAAIGDLRSLVDLLVLTGYFCLFSAGRFAFKLYTYGHNLDPQAPFKIPGFMPPLLGEKQIANFSTWSYPRAGSLWIALFLASLAALTLWQVLRDWRRVEPVERGPGANRGDMLGA
jgi:hypothetical protein